MLDCGFETEIVEAERTFLRQTLNSLEEAIFEEERERREAVRNFDKELADDNDRRIDRLVKKKQNVWHELRAPLLSEGD